MAKYHSTSIVVNSSDKNCPVDTVRKSLDKTKTFVKWEGEIMPSSVDNLTTKEGPYTYSEICTILSGTDWSEPKLH